MEGVLRASIVAREHTLVQAFWMIRSKSIQKASFLLETQNVHLHYAF